MNELPIAIEPFSAGAWPEAWRIRPPVFAKGDTCAYAPDISEADAFDAWITVPRATFVAKAANGTVVGIYYLKPNQPGLGSHVANAGYIVRDDVRGRGVASALCRHSLEVARRSGFTAMQFNCVVATNLPAVHLWTKLGFSTIGRVPGAFRHKDLGPVDTLIMWKRLEADAGVE
jgi:GNAT superfamily N-acetyltransferase